MRFVQVLLIFAAFIGWSGGETTKDHSLNQAINHKHNRVVLDYMNTDANPCWDFYEYACGKWSYPHADNGKRYWNMNEMLNHQVNMELIQYMDNTRMTNSPEFVKKAYEFYTSCTDIEDFNGLHYMRWMEEQANMTWVLLSASEDTDAVYDWVHSLATMRQYGMNGVFIEESMTTDASRKLVSLSKSLGNLAYKPILEYEMRELNETVKLPAGKPPLMEFWKEISDFEKLLTKLYAIEDERAEQVVTLKELRLPWLRKYLAIVLQLDLELDADLQLTIKDIDYMEALDALLKLYDAKFICRYLEVRFLLHLYENSQRSSDLKCIASTRDLLPMTMHWIYEQLHPELEEELPNIKQMFGKILKNVYRILQTDKGGIIPPKTLSQLADMQLKVGNLPRDDTVKVLNTFYANLTLESADYYGNLLQLLSFHFKLDHISSTAEVALNINQFFDTTERYGGSDIYPRYISAANVLIVPVELLRLPFYHWHYSSIFKYSSLGSFMAHCMYSTLQLVGLGEADIQQIADIGSLYSTFETVFSSLPADINEYQFIVELMEVPMKQLFFINAVQYHCTGDGDGGRLNRLVEHLPQFAQAFDCKFNNFLKIFRH